MKSLTIRSPAKLNLYLKVTGRLPNGYHSLMTIFHRISLCDVLKVSEISQPGVFRLSVSGAKISAGEDNLVTRAYRLLQKKIKNLPGLQVNLQKKIPAGGGLGGGSSNAASFMLAANRLLRLKLSTRQLVNMGKTLGADVPFFLYESRHALAKGVGDKLRYVPFRTKLYFVLVLSSKGLKTPEVYQGLKNRLKVASLTKVSRVATILSDILAGKKIVQASRLLENDLEVSAFRLRPSIQKTISCIEKMGLPAVRMSGSGPSVFIMLSSLHQAQVAAQKIRKRLPNKQVIVSYSY